MTRSALFAQAVRMNALRRIVHSQVCFGAKFAVTHQFNVRFYTPDAA